MEYWILSWVSSDKQTDLRCQFDEQNHQHNLSFCRAPALPGSNLQILCSHAARAHSAHRWQDCSTSGLACMNPTYCSKRPDSRKLSSWRWRPRLRSLLTYEQDIHNM